MDQSVVDSLVTLVIRAPNQKYTDQTINCCQNWTVEKLKAHLSDVYPSKPSSKDQRLVYSGKLLLDHFTLKDVLRKDEYHMLHLVCASRTPPSSPKPPRSHSNKPQESPSSPTPLQSSTSSFTAQQSQTSSAESGDGLRQRTGHFPDPHMYSQFMHRWNQYPPQTAPPTNMPPYYNPMTLIWWQQLYAQQYYMHYHLLAASSQHLSQDPASPQSNRLTDQPEQQPPGNRRGNPEVQMNAQGGEILNEEELNRDWLDWVYTFSRAAILLSVVYFYSSFSRFITVMMAMLVLYLHQAGWFPFNLENELFPDRANQDVMEAELHDLNLQEMEGLMDDGSDDDGESGEEGAEDPNSGPQAGFFSSTWSFIITFFMSLIPEGPPNAAN
ncbi:homocysteine-responsive endoplasmic reticulum-resident ubiquitin-like domain member 2 protein isoform X2 [Notolabrus celidotus]|uniref:homocysteine-responsive endoplasmic reticulum-resident ubiquitin-like domain member 2 protein isoform X2 n=1 Tax=Notolabrus celidotus TaxID=1203425 RepID=UPI0014905111|nr:homocysteine-responsive endoplasmic reticulum-resident ubiquitin-like domain member 2 protein isoform X2 [Notolabrus celidotus]